MIHSMEIELLVVEHCANDRAASELLRTALAGLGMQSDAFHTTVIADEEQAQRRGFTGSPTFLIDSIDPFLPPRQQTGLSCRIYRGPDTASGLPTVAGLCDALAAASARANTHQR